LSLLDDNVRKCVTIDGGNGNKIISLFQIIQFNYPLYVTLYLVTLQKTHTKHIL